MRLALELMGDDSGIEDLKSDVAGMQRMVQAYLDFARGEGTEEPRETDLAALLDELIAVARRDGADISQTLPEDCVLMLRPDAMQRCLANLLRNAQRYGSHIWVSAMPRRDGVDILIDDDGPGIPPAERETVFRPFQRLDNSRSPDTGGLGLGLAIARDVARGHGGEITLEDSPQGGLRVRVHLPN
jgi:two-component system osmolarity sensor histidine kinase EnvZ